MNVTPALISSREFTFPCLEFLEASATLFVRSTPSPSIQIMRISRACLIAAPSAVLVVVAVQRSSSRVHSKRMHGNKYASTQSSDASRRRLAAIHCDSVNNGMCYLNTATTVASESTFTPSSLLFNGASVEDSVKSLVVQSTVECEALSCLINFQEFELLQIAGSVLGSDIRIEVETLHVSQSGIISGTARGYVAGQGPSPGWIVDYSYEAMGAGHGGKGGYWAIEDASSAAGVYNSSTMPTDFGSGGTDSSGGGRIYIMATLKVEVDGSISEDGGGCAGTTWCASASGGSIYIASEDVLGTGYITANGGALAELSDDLVATAVVASGGGGRIAIYSNAQSAGLTIDASGGAITDQLPANAQGEKGTVYTEFFSSTMIDADGSSVEEGSTPATAFVPTAATTTFITGSTVEITSTSATTSDIFASPTYSPTKFPYAMLVNDSPTTHTSTLAPTCLPCYNYGSLTSDCRCECLAPWVGDDCSFCPLECINGGQLNEFLCYCICEPEWTGDDCSSPTTPESKEEPEPNNVPVIVAVISAVAATSFVLAVLAILAIKRSNNPEETGEMPEGKVPIAVANKIDNWPNEPPFVQVVPNPVDPPPPPSAPPLEV